MSKFYYFDVIDTDLGPLTAVANGDGTLTELWTSDATERLSAKANYVRDAQAVAFARPQLEEYSLGSRRQFDLPIAPHGSDFQHRVWEQLVLIPYGQTRSYGELAAILGNPNGSRAVGRANATNPISIVVPCHRVIGSSGALIGYAGGLPMKRKLLELEGIVLPTLFDV